METEVTVYGPLRSATGAKTITLEWAGGTVADAVAALVDAYPRSGPHLYDGDVIRPSVRVSINGERAALEAPVRENASLTVFPAVQGGDGSR
ncbi:MoaD/ThiS family protein [Halopiger aswanensis]|uniref:Molybdopterin converting factor small subunit n=1 Tax=Halopiger aswanensis TaxID=148449 RepID=A0A3R7KJL1_9EURY|nr:MoaD/ThiS family protein [Halopiger aswanensis]RKD93449.1 molybdopterin converting factor small subunit [Halopiger aswanensis]